MDKLNLTAMLHGLNPSSLTGYKMVNNRVARVVISASGRTNTRELRASVESNLPEGASVIPESFRWLDNNRNSMIGFVCLSSPQRLLENDDPTKVGFRLIAKNMYMSEEDASVWEMKTSAAGVYMSRNGQDDLSELLEASRVSPNGTTPRISAIANAKPAPMEFVAFVNSFGPGLPSVDHGFVVASGNDRLSLVTATYTDAISVTPDEVISSHSLDRDEMKSMISSSPANASKITSSVVTASSSKADMISYYKKLYSYAPEYLRLVIKEINESAAI